MVGSLSPTISGTTCVRDAPVLQPASRRPARSASAPASRRARRSGSVRTMESAARAAPTDPGARPQVKMKLRERLIR